MNAKAKSTAKSYIERPFVALFSPEDVDSTAVSAYVAEIVNRAFSNNCIIFANESPAQLPDGVVWTPNQSQDRFPNRQEIAFNWPKSEMMADYLSF